jgi:hypothetical protein
MSLPFLQLEALKKQHEEAAAALLAEMQAEAERVKEEVIAEKEHLENEKAKKKEMVMEQIQKQ